MRKFLSVFTIICTIIGMFIVLAALTGAVEGAPQQCVLLSTAIAFAVLPYCILKASIILNKDSSLLKMNILLEKLLIQSGSKDADEVTIEEIKTGKIYKMKIDKFIEFIGVGSNDSKYRTIRDDLAKNPAQTEKVNQI